MRAKTYRVTIRKRALRRVGRLPLHIQQRLALLVQDLRDLGPTLPRWPNYSRLGDDTYHCHLTRSWVACWRHRKKTIAIEVYYVGSREKAPY